MNDDDVRFGRMLEELLLDSAPVRAPARLRPDIASATRPARQRPRWLVLMRESPMRLPSGVAVGSPTLRLVYLLTLALLLTVVVTAAGVAGASLLPGSAIIVAQDGSGTVTTITDAIAIAQDGDTVLVKPGTYLESIAITADITLRGDGDPGAVVLEFADDGPTAVLDADPEFPVAYGVLLDHSDARVENLTVRGRIDAEGEIWVGAVVIDGGSPVIERIDVILDDEPYPDYAWLARSAFQITGGSTAVIRSSSWDGFTRILGLASSPTFEDNTVTAQRISIWAGGHRPTIRGNTLVDGAAIVFADPGVSAIVEDNDIDGRIFGPAGDDTIIRDNRIRGGGEPADGRPGSAIGITGPGTAIVEGNAIDDSPYGIDISGGAGPHVSGNTIRGSSFIAVTVDSGTAPTIDGNVIEDNAIGIDVRGVATTPVITGNAFCGNETDLKVPDGSTLSLEGNTVCEPGASDAP
jgi:nitrous oxidase accessory protein NosD